MCQGSYITYVLSSRQHKKHVFFKAAGYEGIEQLLEAHSGFISRQLSLLLRKHFSLGLDKSRPTGLPTLLRVVLKLNKNEDDKALRDVISVLLRQLDISWMDSDASLTQDILNVISIFVRNFQVTQAKSDHEEVKTEVAAAGKMTRLIQGNLHLRPITG